MSEHSKREHALLSASGSSRWLNCTPSARLEDEFEETTSDADAEGTLAHEYAELMLQKHYKRIDAETFKKGKIRVLTSEHYYDGMLEPVMVYVDYVKTRFKAAKRRNKQALLLIEERVDLTDYVPDGFGSCDTVIVSDGIMDVIDLKFGKGIQVESEDNTQLMLYALGALVKYELLFDIHTVQMTIVQPRLDHISTTKMNVGDLLAWGETVVKPKAAIAFKGEGDFCSGSWCRWCKFAPTCRALADANMAITKLDFEPDDDIAQKLEKADIYTLLDRSRKLSDHEMIAVLEKADVLVKWAASIKEYMLKEALKGHRWKGYKLVAGRSNRKWTDADKVKNVLFDNNFEPNEILTAPKMMGIPDIEKLLGKNDFNEKIAQYVIKPEGAPTLVPEADKRTELNSIEQLKEDFKD